MQPSVSNCRPQPGHGTDSMGTGEQLADQRLWFWIGQSSAWVNSTELIQTLWILTECRDLFCFFICMVALAEALKQKSRNLRDVEAWAEAEIKRFQKSPCIQQFPFMLQLPKDFKTQQGGPQRDECCRPCTLEFAAENCVRGRHHTQES